MESLVEDLQIGSIHRMPAKDLYYRFWNKDKKISSFAVPITNTPHYTLANTFFGNRTHYAKAKRDYDNYIQDLATPGNSENKDFTSSTFEKQMREFSNLNERGFNETPVNIARDPVSKVFYIVDEPGATKASYRAVKVGENNDRDIVVKICSDEGRPSITGVSKGVMSEEKDTSSQLKQLKLHFKESPVFGSGDYKDSVNERDNIRYGDITKISIWCGETLTGIQVEYGGVPNSGNRFGELEGVNEDICLQIGERLTSVKVRCALEVYGIKFISNYETENGYGFSGEEGGITGWEDSYGYYLGAIEGFNPAKKNPDGETHLPRLKLIFKRWA